MGRHGGSSGGRGLPLFQIEVLDFSARKQGYDSYDRRMFKDENGIIRKTVDTLPEIPCRTIVQRFKDYKAALRFGQRFGTVKECRKVDTIPYLSNINYLNLDQKPIAIEMEREEEFELTDTLEVRRTQEPKLDVEID
jgi:hypothetical protein